MTLGSSPFGKGVPGTPACKIMTQKKFDIIFTSFALIAFLAVLYHVKGIFYPTADTTGWRHAVFVVINIIGIFGLIKRSNWFILFVMILTVHQWYSHGSYAYMLWQKEHSIHWISLGVIIFLPLLLILLIAEKKNKKKV